MDEIEHQDKEKFTPKDVTVTVTCKPKHVYCSSATNWGNDLLFVRYLFRKEHELRPNDILPKEVLDILVILRDTLLQCELMSIQEDYLRASEGGHHLAREKLRHDVIMKRLDICLSSLGSVDALQLVCVKTGAKRSVQQNW